MTLTALSPLHIGTGEELSPLDYIIDVPQCLLCRVDTAALLADLPASAARDFEQALDDTSLTWMRQFIARHFDVTRHLVYACPVDRGLAQLYERSLRDARNQLLVQPHLRRPDTWAPIVPGSSIKGALRTAVVSRRAQDWSPRGRIDHNGFEAEVLGYDSDRQRSGDIRRDPFRCLRIEDLTLPDDAITVDPVRIFKPDRGNLEPDPGGIQMFYERTWSLLDEETIQGSARLSIDDQLPAKTAVDQRRGQTFRLAGGLDVAGIRQDCLDFYGPKLRQDHEKFYVKAKALQETNAPLLAVQFGPDEFPIRLGRHSHVECVTVDKHREPKTRRNPRTGQPMGYGNTRSLVHGELALGWAKVKLEPLR